MNKKIPTIIISLAVVSLFIALPVNGGTETNSQKGLLQPQASDEKGGVSIPEESMALQKVLYELISNSTGQKVLAARSYTEADLAAAGYSEAYVPYGRPSWGRSKFQYKLTNSCFVTIRVKTAIHMDTLAISNLRISDDAGRTYQPIAFNPDNATGEFAQQWFGVNSYSKIVYKDPGGDRGGLILLMNPPDRSSVVVHLIYEIPLATRKIALGF